MSTIAPAVARDVGAKLAACGIEFLDAPVSGGEVGAKAATLTIMVGGKAAVFDKVKPLFEKMGKSATLIGDCGAGQVAKACNQILTGVGVAAVAEAFNFARKSGVDPARVAKRSWVGSPTARFWRTTVSACWIATSNPVSRPGCTRRICASSWKKRTSLV